MMKNKPDYLMISLTIICWIILILGVIGIFIPEKREITYKFEPMPIEYTIYTCSDTIKIKDTILIK